MAHPLLTLAAALVAAALTVLPVRATQRSQASPPQPTFTAKVDLIKVAVAVFDRNRQFVSGLRKEDFVLSDDGRPQQIATFSSDRVAISLGIVLDSSTSNLSDSRWAFARSVFAGLFDRLAPDDELFVAEFSDRSHMLQTWTSDREALRRGVDRVRGGSQSGLYDAVSQMLNVARTGHRDRKTLLLISDGDNNYGMTIESTARELARRSDVLVYALALEETRPGFRKANAGALRRLTDATGGRTQIVQPGERVDDVVQQLAAELGQQYLIGYPPPAGPPGRWHDIQVKLPGRKDVVVRAREGYVSN